MGFRRRSLFALSVFLLLFLFLSCSPLIVLGSPKKPAATARREDIPFIKCQVCKHIAREVYALVQKNEALIAPKRLSEFQIIEIAENVCNLKKEEADWILRIDIIEKGDKLELVDQGTEGQCNSECKTIERACQEVMGYSDTDVAEYVFKFKPSVDSLTDFLCNDLSKSCAVKPPPVPKDRIPGEPFAAKSSKEAEMEKILRSMEGMPGAPSMKMYSREDLMNNNFGDDESDEDEEEDKFPSNLGKALGNHNYQQKDFKLRILEGISETKKVIKRHVNNVSGKIKKWWKGRKTSSKPPKKSKSEL